MRPPARRCWWCTISIPRRKRLTRDRRARCPRRSTNSTSSSPAWDQVRRQNDTANPYNERFQASSAVRMAAFLLMTLVMTAVSAQQKPTTGYAPVNGINMYYEIHGGGEPVVLLHGAFMTALLNYLKIPRADLIGYSMGGAVAMQCAIRHPDKVRRAVIISSTFRRDGMIAEALEAIPKLTADAFKGSPIEAEYKKLSPTPDDFPNFVQRMVATASKEYDFGADKLKATTTPMFFIHGDADGVRLAHIAEMFRLKGGEIHGDMQPRSASRLAILPDTTHVTLMQRIPIIVPMVNAFLDAKP